ncbi:MAG: M1 family metallopeptidase [Chitinophagales bacterium]|nr:M1 family metallopeptidase [Chitinophagales bacterium]
MSRCTKIKIKNFQFSQIVFTGIAILLTLNLSAQNTRDNGFQLLHTQLNIQPNFHNRTIKGNATLNILAKDVHRDTLILDAKGMTFDSIFINQEKATYTYDGMQIHFALNEAQKNTDTLNVHIFYTAHPYQLNEKQRKLGQGAYFINTSKTNPYRKTLFWTQGETEASSCWFPTIEQTHQKTSQDILVTIPDSLTSISNGKLIQQVKNNDGTRTDHWQQMKVHSPYLFALIVGPYKEWKAVSDITPVSYFAMDDSYSNVESNYAHTPEMIDYFSTIFRYKYPWDNYKQVAVYDFVAGAMENTSLSVFNEDLTIDPISLQDKRWRNDLIIAHELVHQWFGDLVTPEDWSQLTLSESFANFGESLWLEKWKGEDDAAVFRYKAFNRYMNEYLYKKTVPLVQRYEESPDDLFDRHRYNKGGLILQNLRKYLGDETFFSGLKNYLQENEYNSATVRQLQQSFEKVSGKSLNWFFNQWYYSAGHPIVDFYYQYDSTQQAIVIKTLQKQRKHLGTDIPVFKIPLNIDIYMNDSVLHQELIINDTVLVFRINVSEAPLAINIDPGKQMLWEIKTHHRPDEIVYLYKSVKSAIDKVFLTNELRRGGNYDLTAQILLTDFESQHWYVKQKILELCLLFSDDNKKVLKEILLQNLKRQESIERNLYLTTLQKLNSSVVVDLAKELLQSDSSYLVKSTCLKILKDSLKTDAYPFITPYRENENPNLQLAIASIMSILPQDTDLSFFERSLLTIHNRYTDDLCASFENYLLSIDKKTYWDGLQILKNIIESEYPNKRVKQAKSVLETLQIKEKNHNRKKRRMAKRIIWELAN